MVSQSRAVVVEGRFGSALGEDIPLSFSLLHPISYWLNPPEGQLAAVTG